MKIKTIELGEILGISANICVVVGIVFLGFEIRQVQDQLEAEIEFNQFSSELETRKMIIASPSLARAIAKNVTGEELSTEEVVVIEAYVATVLIGNEYSFKQYQRGRDEGYDPYGMVNWIERDFWGVSKRVFDRMKGSLDEDYVVFIEQELEQY